MLETHRDRDVRVFTVWEPIQPADFAPPITSVLHRMPDRRVQQYWDHQHLVARQMAADARPPQPTQDCCLKGDILWDIAAVYPPGVMWEARLPPAVVFNGPVVDVANQIAATLGAQPAAVR